LRHHLFLLKELVKRDFQGRYAGSALGLVWSFLQPLWMLLLFTFVFSTVMKISLAGARTGHFAIFLFSGLLPWLALQEGVMRSSTAITDNSSLVKKLRFPAEILVLAVVLAALLHEAIAAAIFLGVLAFLGELKVGGLPLLLLALPLQIALTLGLGLLLSAVNVFFRDIAQVLGMVFTGWFYLTPIVYPATLVPESLRSWVALNPHAHFSERFREAFTGAASFGGSDVVVVLACVALAAGGFWFFRRLSPYFEELV
jgi:lipopolysaccharide transport system permease protein